jgi:hypothetical protein
VFCWDKREDVKAVLTGGENLNKVPLGRENSDKLMQAGKTLENQSFSQILFFKVFIFKASTSWDKKWRDF